MDCLLQAFTAKTKVFQCLECKLPQHLLILMICATYRSAYDEKASVTWFLLWNIVCLPIGPRFWTKASFWEPEQTTNWQIPDNIYMYGQNVHISIPYLGWCWGRRRPQNSSLSKSSLTIKMSMTVKESSPGHFGAVDQNDGLWTKPHRCKRLVTGHLDFVTIITRLFFDKCDGLPEILWQVTPGYLTTVKAYQNGVSIIFCKIPCHQ